MDCVKKSWDFVFLNKNFRIYKFIGIICYWLIFLDYELTWLGMIGVCTEPIRSE